MDIIEQLKIFTIASGGIAASGEILSYFIRNKVNRVGRLARGYIESKYKLENILGNTGLILSKDIQLKEQFDFEGSVTIAPTGSGKTSSFFFPNLLSNNIKGSIIVTDPKEELFKLTSKYQEKICGRKVLKFSPLSPGTSEKYNLLTSCKDDSEIIELASTLLFNGALSIELST
ncbi:hypothetical protein FDF26_12155 [Clostridium botulinum]|uniref:type IV secretory system conjugative DNA transfer family protein n=1 Tax=Clostridium sp. CH2 TaxID=2949990 RepID=UPI0013F99A53|nr:type IV secretory system conjugative DNA transfer family protein [Clostridium sp. CH2]NFT07804.1 hypothetical protein [Clostridium botulinum]